MTRLLLVVLLLAGMGAGLWFAQQAPEPAARDLVLHGNMDIRQAALAFDASGRIERMLVEEGEIVAPGQTLATLDTTRARLALAEARARVDVQRAALARLEAGSRPEEIRQAAAELAAARVAARDARQVLDRQLDLVAKHFAPEQQADSARNAFDAATQRVQAASELHRLAVLGPRQEDRAVARATLAAQEAEVARLEHEVAQGALLAPAAGVIESRVAEVGDMATPARAVYVLTLNDAPWARVYLPEPALGRIARGARATISSDSAPERRHAAWVGYVAPVAEFTPKNIETTELRTSLVYQAQVYACAGSGAEALRQGMPVTVHIPYDQPLTATQPCAPPP